MNFKGWLVRWQFKRSAKREARLRALANAEPSFQWIIVRAGTSVQSRSPMLTPKEIRDWFKEEFPNSRIVHIDNDNKIVFYE